MADSIKPSIEDWQALASGELGGKPLESLTWRTPEGIAIKPLYTTSDLERLDGIGNLPGFAPYTRGVRATMYANRPWTIRQYAGFSDAEESNKFYRENLKGGRRASPSRSISRLIAATTAIIPAWSAMSARPASRSTASRT